MAARRSERNLWHSFRAAGDDAAESFPDVQGRSAGWRFNGSSGGGAAESTFSGESHRGRDLLGNFSANSSRSSSEIFS
eukprot:5096897-Pyramimonas_sp.AAC.1